MYSTYVLWVDGSYYGKTFRSADKNPKAYLQLWTYVLHVTESIAQ